CGVGGLPRFRPAPGHRWPEPRRPPGAGGENRGDVGPTCAARSPARQRACEGRWSKRRGPGGWQPPDGRAEAAVGSTDPSGRPTEDTGWTCGGWTDGSGDGRSQQGAGDQAPAILVLLNRKQPG